MAPKLSLVVFGASGDLARRLTFPALLRLFARGDLDFFTTKIIGIARSDLGKDGLVKRIRQGMPEPPQDDQPLRNAYEQFLSEIEYVRASDGYDGEESYITLNKYLEEVERMRDAASAVASHAPDVSAGAQGKNMRIFYLALPPSSFAPAATMIHKHCWSEQTINRCIIEKPYGTDLASAKELSTTLAKFYAEEDIYRVDHYLGKDILRQLLALRFSLASNALGSLFHHNRVSYVTVDFKETIGIEGRGSYFDNAGIVRDVMQNHVINLLIFATMEQPRSLSAQDLVAARLELIQSITTVRPEDVIIGQYGPHPTNPEKKSYRDDLTTKNDSKTSTYAACVFYINNSRWHGVPFILRGGKALDEDRVELSLHFKLQASPLFPQAVNSSLVIRDKPTTAIELNTSAKKPGYSFDIIPITLGSNLEQIRAGEYVPEPYEALFHAAILEEDRTWFVSREEAEALWRIWESYLSEVEGIREPFIYPIGSKGPVEADDFILGYVSERRRMENVSASEIAHAVAAEVGRIVEQGKVGVHKVLKQVGIEE